MSQKEENALNEFLDDISCLNELKKWGGGFNVFDVLNISRNEIRHSNVLAWLFNASGDHGLGDRVLYNVLNEVIAKNPNHELKQTKLLLLDLESFDVRREEEHIDLLLISRIERFVIAIENKIFSGEHSNQLARYKEYIEKNFDGYETLYLYLTPDGDDSSDGENWLSLSYNSVYSAIEKALKEKDVKDDVKSFIDDYLEILRRKVMEDNELKEVCERIYKKHKTALDLIYENCDIGNASIYKEIRVALLQMEKDGKIIYEDKETTTFYLQEADEKIPMMAEANSSYGTRRSYTSWVKWKTDRVVVLFELGGFNLTDEQRAIHKKMIENGHGKGKRFDDYKYQRIERVEEPIKGEEDDADAIKKATINAIEKLIKKVHDCLID